MPKIKGNRKDFNNHIQNFIDYCNIKGLAIKTIKSYYQALTLFCKYLEEEKDITDINKVNKEVVEEYLKFTKDRGKYSYVANKDSLKKTYQDSRPDIGKEISPSTLNNYLRNIKVFFNWLDENNYILNNTVIDVKYVKNKRTSKDQLTDEEYKKLIKTMDLSKFHEYRDYVITNLIFDTGMRLSECLSLTYEEVDIVNKTIFLSATVTKGKRDRYVFYSDKMGKLLRRWLKYKDVMVDSDLLFPTQRTNRMMATNNYERNFRVYLKNAHIDKNVTPHSLRNNFARRFLLNGGDIFMLSKILGHSSVMVTEKAYLDVTTEDIRKKYIRYSPMENLK
ncbi:tyrosine-type recombinase/integrase [uncultured Clostridium sp.]|uniref:tyrosine-type recombinase/integrase n=1 Tax=uncultured Clostridium sp. TaxID=59620 RepID=UPI002628EC63|nr:tyrosine-type recombinase/integrase [uncultured Clostridium sp.]